MSATLLLEIGLEELPPAAMRALMNAFADGIGAGLDQAGLAHGRVSGYATPRRLAVTVTDAEHATPARQVEKPGPTLAVAFDNQGNPTAAGDGFARSVGVSVEALEHGDSDKGKRLVYRGEQPGEPLQAILPGIVDQTLQRLPIPKRMRWGDRQTEFVRPVHWIVAMHGAGTLSLTVFGMAASNQTFGHRFLHPEPISLASADEYADKLFSPGCVIADPDTRRATIEQQLAARADEIDATPLVRPELLEEVTALVEWPVALAGRFERRYLDLPREVLIATLEDHQRYFPVTSGNRLCNAFITVANIDSLDASRVIAGNERVIRPRLADALFFWQQDCKTGLTAFAQDLEQVSFQQGLGSLADKSTRVQALAGWLADAGGGDSAGLAQAAALAKADLLTAMVDEFPQLQGIMGYYYALEAGVERSVALAIGEHYAPTGAGSAIAATRLGRLLAVADRLDTLAGAFSLGKRPSGDKDPFALRRAALGVLRTLIEGGLSIDLAGAIDKALSLQPGGVSGTQPGPVATELFEFHLERLRGYYVEQGYTPAQFEAVAATGVSDMLDFDRRMTAVSRFVTLTAATVVCAAHKRARNILKKNGSSGDMQVKPALLSDHHEQQLARALSQQRQVFDQAMAAREYPEALASLADLAEPLDAFFEHVMVMADNEDLRCNRLALLATLDYRCRQVADISRLSAQAAPP